MDRPQALDPGKFAVYYVILSRPICKRGDKVSSYHSVMRGSLDRARA